MIVPDEGGAFEAAEPDFAEFYKSRDSAACSDAIVRFFARDQGAMRAAARRAAANVRSDRDHAVELVAHYQAVIDARARQAA
jgi:alpha-1,6-mannosyltransferase